MFAVRCCIIFYTRAIAVFARIGGESWEIYAATRVKFLWCRNAYG